jgi:hypothetical protein
VSFFTKLSRSRLSLARVARSNAIFESDEKVPSSLRTNVPVAPVATSTASDGRLTPTSCSRTRTVAFEELLIVQVPIVAVVVVALADALALGEGAVATAVAAAGVPAPPHEASRKPTVATGEIMRARDPLIIGSSAVWSVRPYTPQACSALRIR